MTNMTSAVAEWIKRITDYVEETVKKGIAITQDFSWEEFKESKKKIVEEVAVMINGVACIVAEITDGVEKLAGSKRKAILGVSLIAANDCNQSMFDDSWTVLHMASEAFVWIGDYDFELVAICTNLLSAFKNVEDFLEACVDNSDPVYNDTRVLVELTTQIFRRYCSNEKHRRQFNTCECRCNCTQKNELILKEVGLVNDDNMTEAKRMHVQATLEEVCLAIKNVSKCENTTCAEGEDEKPENVLARGMNSFCTTHPTWEPFKPPGIFSSNAPRKTTTKVGTGLLQAAFYYLTLIISMAI